MGTLNIATTATDGGGNNRNSGGSIAPGGLHEPRSFGELAPLTHAYTWTPGPSQAFVSGTVTAVEGDSGISPGWPNTTGDYRDLFPTVFFEWTTPQPDVFNPPLYHTGTMWSDLPAPADSDLTQFDCHNPVERTRSYTIVVNWVNTSSGSPGVDTFSQTDTIYMDFWLHNRLTTERGQ